MKEQSKKTKKHETKSRIVILIIGLLLTIIGITCINALRTRIADLILPDTMKESYMVYDTYSEGAKIPTRMQYLTNNGKLYSFCQTISSVIVAALFLVLGKKWGGKIFEKLPRDSIKEVSRKVEILVLFLAIITFTTKVNQDKNIDKYTIKFDYSNYSEQSDSFAGDKERIIGYVKQKDIDNESDLIAVYESPERDSAPVEDKNILGKTAVFLIRNIDNICTYSEMLTIILGVYIFVVNDYHKRSEETAKQ